MRCSSLLVPVIALATCIAAQAQAPSYHLGRTPTQQEIRAWDISISPQGEGLPPGSGMAKEGAKIYAERCAECHGKSGTESETSANARRAAPALVGGQGTLNTPNPVRTIGSFWPFATTVWDYINRTMPLFAEGSLSADEVYAVTAFLLYRNAIIRESDVMDARTLPKVRMPNRDGFVPARPQWKAHSDPNRGR
jgi:mono/diheme cytochrome c family protein